MPGSNVESSASGLADGRAGFSSSSAAQAATNLGDETRSELWRPGSAWVERKRPAAPANPRQRSTSVGAAGPSASPPPREAPADPSPGDCGSGGGGGGAAAKAPNRTPPLAEGDVGTGPARSASPSTAPCVLSPGSPPRGSSPSLESAASPATCGAPSRSAVTARDIRDAICLGLFAPREDDPTTMGGGTRSPMSWLPPSSDCSSDEPSKARDTCTIETCAERTCIRLRSAETPARTSLVSPPTSPRSPPGAAPAIEPSPSSARSTESESTQVTTESRWAGMPAADLMRSWTADTPPAAASSAPSPTASAPKSSGAGRRCSRGSLVPRESTRRRPDVDGDRSLLPSAADPREPVRAARMSPAARLMPARRAPRDAGGAAPVSES